MRIKISNERIWQWCQDTGDIDCIDTWLQNNVGFGNWAEYTGLNLNLPYRSFSFRNESDAILFTLRWS